MTVWGHPLSAGLSKFLNFGMTKDKCLSMSCEAFLNGLITFLYLTGCLSVRVFVMHALYPVNEIN